MAVFLRTACRRARRATRILFPNAGDFRAAVRAASTLEPVLGDIVPGAAEEHRAAAWATGMRAFAVDVPLVHIVQADLSRDLPCAVQRFRGSFWFIAELEIGMKRGE